MCVQLPLVCVAMVCVCVCMFGRTLEGIMVLTKHAEKKVEILRFVQVFPSNFFFSYIKKLLLCLNDEGFMQLFLRGGGDQKEEHPQLLVQT